MKRERFSIEYPEIDIDFLLRDALVDSALTLMELEHRDERRRILDQPFIVHPIGAARIATKYPDESLVFNQSLALLHDVFDSKATPKHASMASLKENFGFDIALGVASLSKSKKLASKQLQREDYLKMRRQEEDPRVQFVAAADKIDNLRAAGSELEVVGPEFWTHFNGGREVYVQWPQDVLDAIRVSHTIDAHQILDEYEAEIEAFQRIVERVDMLNKAS